MAYTPPPLRRHVGSWIIKERATGAVICEIFRDDPAINVLNGERYEAIPADIHLASLSRKPYTVVALVQEGESRGRFWHVRLSSAAAFFDHRDGTPGEAPEVGAEFVEGWEVVAIIPGHVTPEFLTEDF